MKKMTYEQAPEGSLVGTVVQTDVILSYLCVPPDQREPWQELMARNGHLERVRGSRPARYVYDDNSLIWLVQCIEGWKAGGRDPSSLHKEVHQ